MSNWISAKTYEQLRNVCALAQKQTPVQGEFSFSSLGQELEPLRAAAGIMELNYIGCISGVDRKAVLANAESLLKIVAELVDIGVAVANVEQRVIENGGIQEQDMMQLYTLREQYSKASRGVIQMPNLSWFSFEPHN